MKCSIGSRAVKHNVAWSLWGRKPPTPQRFDALESYQKEIKTGFCRTSRPIGWIKIKCFHTHADLMIRDGRVHGCQKSPTVDMFGLPVAFPIVSLFV